MNSKTREYGASEDWTERKYSAAKAVGTALAIIAGAKKISSVNIWDMTAGPGIDSQGRKNVLLNVLEGFCSEGDKERLRCCAIEGDEDRCESLYHALENHGYSDIVETRCGLFSEVVKEGEVKGWGLVLFDPVPDKAAIDDANDLTRIAGGMDIATYCSATALKRLEMKPHQWLDLITTNGRQNCLWNDPRLGKGSGNAFQWMWLWASRAKINGPFRSNGEVIKPFGKKDHKWLYANNELSEQKEFWPESKKMRKHATI